MLGTLAPAWPEGRVCRDTVGAVGTVRRIVRSDSGFCESSETIFRNRGRQEAEEERKTILLSLTVGWMFGGAPRERRAVWGVSSRPKGITLAKRGIAFTPRAHVIDFVHTRLSREAANELASAGRAARIARLRSPRRKSRHYDRTIHDAEKAWIDSRSRLAPGHTQPPSTTRPTLHCILDAS